MNIVFISNEDTARAPMACAFMKQLAIDKHLDLNATSAGIYVTDDEFPSDEVSYAAELLGVSIRSHSCSLMNEDILSKADLILTMTSMNKASVLNMLPDAYDKLYTLKEYVFSFKEDLPDDFYDGTSDIAVPRSGDVSHNINCAAQIYYLVWSIANELSEHGEIVMKNTILQ